MEEKKPSELKRFRVELSFGASRGIFTRFAECVEAAIREAMKENEDKGQFCSLIAAWEVKDDQDV